MSVLGLPCFAENVHSVKCGTKSVGQMVRSGWKIEKTGHLSEVESNRLKLDDGSAYRADMTSGMLSGDRAILLVKHVRTEKANGDIFTLCAGGVDAWVTPEK